tara:strand:- start:15260 stop:16132 length:873 start_codon:yes stop_codon:yes gene_type:complete
MKYVIADDGTVSAMAAGQAYVFGKSHPSYERLVTYLKSDNVEYFEAAYDVISRINDFCEGYVSCSSNKMTWDGIPMPDMFTDRILDMLQEGFPFEPMLNFLDNISQNPSDHAIVELFDFMDNKHMPITSDGCFLAYKAVDEEFKDLWSHSFDNSVGSTCEVPRSDVDSNRDRGCSNGLHVGAIDYAAQYGGIDLKDRDDDDDGNNIVICKVNPMDVVSVPTCSRFQKLRCCKYEVVSLFQDKFDSVVYMTQNEIDCTNREARSDEWKQEITIKLDRIKGVLDRARKMELV